MEAILTRNSDTDVSLEERANIANQSGAVCFVSVHCNSGPSGARGAETYYHDDSVQGKRLAQCIQGEVAALGLFDRGAKSDFTLYQSGLYVLRETTMPAALVEVEFISSPDGEKWLANPDNQDAAGKAIARGICEYLGVPFVETSPAPGKSFHSGDSSGSGGSGNGPDWSWAAGSVKKLAEKVKFNTPHDPGENVTVALLASILDRLGLLD